MIKQVINSAALLLCNDPDLVDTFQDIVESIEELDLEVCDGIKDAYARMESLDVGLILVHLPVGAQHEEFLEFIRITKEKLACPSLVCSDEYRNHQAVAMLRAGAADYIGLPHDLSKLRYLIEVLTLRARGMTTICESPPERKKPVKEATPSSYVLDPQLVEIMDHLRQVLPQDTTLLLTGETGTGKTRLANLIHDLSPRNGEPFMVVDCASLSDSLIESEIFGHVKGAFTGADRDRVGKFAAVGKGTLLLDDVNSLPLALQAKLLRVVDERVYEPLGTNQLKPFEARLIVASNKPLDQEVRAGRFRTDLFYRLNVIGFYLPPLRERRPAIGPLVNKFIVEFAYKYRRNIGEVSSNALKLLMEYDWPGNIRELRNVIERAVVFAYENEIQVRDLPEPFSSKSSNMHTLGSTLLPCPTPSNNGLKGVAKAEAEIKRITEALAKHKNNRAKAAKELEISRMALYKKMHKYGLIVARNGNETKNEETVSTVG